MTCEKQQKTDSPLGSLGGGHGAGNVMAIMIFGPHVVFTSHVVEGRNSTKDLMPGGIQPNMSREGAMHFLDRI